MTKTEFVENLCNALSNAGAGALVEKNRAYYTEYIDGEIAKGRTEEEVLAELGAPELIANSILEANGMRDRFVDDESKTYNAYDTPDGDPTTFAQGFEYKGKENERNQDSDPGEAAGAGAGQTSSKKGMSAKTKLILVLVIIGLILLGILALLVFVIGGIFKFLGPVIIPLIIIWMIVKLVKS